MLEETRKYKEVSSKELIAMLFTAVVIGFVMSFRSWGARELDIAQGLSTLIIVTVAAFCIIMLRTMAQKWVALKHGYLTTYTFHKYALPASIFLAFFTNGLIPFVSGGDLKIRESKRLRLGSFRYGLNYVDLAIIAVAAPGVCILLMLIIKPLWLLTGNFLIEKIIHTTAAITFFGMLPINGQEGFYLFYHRRWAWLMAFTFITIYFLLVLAAGVFSYVIAALLAGVAWLVYQRSRE